MNIISPPLSSLEREAARTAALAAAQEKRHTGIRPKKDIARRQTAGIKITGFTQIDDAITAARQTWPHTSQFSIFGADSFEANPPVMTSANYGGWWIADADSAVPLPADGCFEGAADYGEFACDPTLELPDSGGGAGPSAPSAENSYC